VIPAGAATMKPDRLTRLNEHLRREIGTFLFRIAARETRDLSVITVTRVSINSDLHTAQVFVSIRAPEVDRPAFLAALNRHRIEIQAHLAQTVCLKYTPRLSFKPDTSLEEGDRILSILATLKNDDSSPPPSGNDPNPLSSLEDNL
jgi:ribosome-binding factor A